MMNDDVNGEPVLDSEYERQEADYERWQAEGDKDGSRAITAAELFNRPPNKISAYCPKFIFPGALTIIAGEPKSGKTTLLLHLLDAVTRGDQFLDGQCSKTNALYVSEQHSAIFREQLIKIPSLGKNSKLHILPLERNCESEAAGADEFGKPIFHVRIFADWSEQVEFWRKQIIQTHARIIVIDTLVSFTNLEADQVNDPGAMTSLFMKLKSLFTTRSDLAIVVLHHLRKGQGPKAKSIRSFNDIAGSYALRAATDQNVLMFIPEPAKHPNRRRILLEGRFAATDSMDIELNASGYALVGNGKHQEDYVATAIDPQDLILDALKADPKLDAFGNAKLAKQLNVTVHQIQTFRQSHPKGTFNPDGKNSRKA